MMPSEQYGHIVEVVSQVVTHWGLWGVFILMAINGSASCPPSEVILPLAGILAALGHATFPEVCVAALVGNLFGASILYVVGRVEQRRLIAFFERRTQHRTRTGISRLVHWFLTSDTVVLCARHFGERRTLWVFVFRFLPVVRSIVSLPAGITGMPLGRFLIYSAAGMSVWILPWVFLGYITMHRWMTYRSIVAFVPFAFLFSVLAVWAHYVRKAIRGRVLAEQRPEPYR